MPISAQAGASPRRPVPSTAGLSRWEFTPDVWVVLAATAIGALLRFDTLGHQSFWVDEATTVHEVGLSFGAMLHSIAHNEATPPLYFACAWVWTRIFSDGEVGIRSFSAIVGTLTIPVVYLCGRELISRWAGAVAAALTAFSPYMLWYSQEARAYMLLAFTCALSLLFTARARRTGRRVDLGLWVLAAAAALATHFFAVLLVIPEGAWLLWCRRERSVALVFAIIIAVEGALSPLALSDASHPLDSWIGGLGLHERLQAIPVDFGASQLYTTSSLRWGFWGAGAVVVFLIALAALSSRQRRRDLLLPTALAAIVILVPVFGAVIGQDYVFSRNLTPAWIPLVVLVGGAACAERGRALGAALLAAVALMFVWADIKISDTASLQRPDWRAAAQALGTATVPRAILIYDGNTAEGPLSLYLPGTTFSYSGQPASRPTLAVAEVDVIVQGLATAPAGALPAGVTEIGGAHYVAGDTVTVYRFRLARPRRLDPQQAGAAFNGSLVTPASSTLSVLEQRPQR